MALHESLGKCLEEILRWLPDAQRPVETEQSSVLLPLLAAGATIQESESAGAKCFEQAVQRNLVDFVRFIPRGKSRVRDEVLSVHLQTVIENKQHAMLTTLIAHGADPNFEDTTALRFAVTYYDLKYATTILAFS